MYALETFNIRQKLFAFIQYTNIDKVKIYQAFHYKVEPLTKRYSEYGTRSREQRRFRKV